MPTQLRVSPELAEDIRFLSRANNRTISLQILDWIIDGIKANKAKLGHMASRPVTSAEPSRVTRRHISSEENVA